MEKKVVIVEEDYKGYFIRYALTAEDFDEFYGDEAKAPTEDWESYTVRPLVHILYKLETIGSEFWREFFSDMSWGFETEDGTPSEDSAYIDLDRCSDCLVAELADYAAAIEEIDAAIERRAEAENRYDLMHY